ncbi:histidine kinase [Stenoxybacter acetivorans]|uniref:histidine kinase n=1 Tax=Stenoxybacter acetivorans TaxID=422441 RepID=UPI001470341F|nr:histidine kinase [Stenoxybacter acetivorans]
MTNKPLHSLSATLLTAIVFWLIGALLFTGMTLNLSWELESGGIAINDAGSLRKRMYHMAALASLPQQQEQIAKEEADFYTVLTRLKNLHAGNWLHSENSTVQKQLDDIYVTAAEFIQEFKKSTQEPTHLNVNQLQETTQFISQIDRLVKTIETENTQNIQLLRLFQFMLIGMVVLSAFIALLFLNQLVIKPLTRLKNGILQIGRGDLSVRISEENGDEFSEVAGGFNRMALNLSDVYDHLEAKIHEKTVDLEEKNHVLRQMYDITAFLHESQTQENMIEGFLKHILNLSQAQDGSLKLFDKNSGNSNASVNPYENSPHENTVSESNETNKITETQFLIQHNQDNIGQMSLFFSNEAALSAAQIKLIEILCSQLGVSIENQRSIQLEKQLAVIEERNLMAQGLHDSIAQSLSFLNLQVQMLGQAIAKKNFEQAEENLRFIREGVQEAYDDVRELLLNFRTRIGNQGFADAVQSVIARFQKQTGIEISSSINQNEPPLDMEQQLQALFILQEALSNVRKHAHATHVTITISYQPNFILTVNDNGFGFDMTSIHNKQDRHVGLGIMNERTSRAKGELCVKSVLQQGTQVILNIPNNTKETS